MRHLNPLLYVCLIVLISAQYLLLAQANAANPDETIVDVTPMQTSAPSQPGLLQSLGRFHPALVHIPIGWMVMVFLLDIGAFILKRTELEKCGYYALIATVLSFIPALITGLLNATHEPRMDPEELSNITMHKHIIFTMAIFAIAALVVRISKRNVLTGKTKLAYLLFILIAVILIAAAGHIGGEIVFGENYFPI